MIRLNDVHAIKLISHYASVPFIVGHHHCIAQYDRNDFLMGGVLFTDWLGGSIQMHQALFGGKCGIRPLIYLSFYYAFEQVKVKKVLGLVPAVNYKALRLNIHLGFIIEHKVEDVFAHPPGHDNAMYIMSMTKEQCKWLDRPVKIVYAPEERTQRIDNPLFEMPTVGGMQ